MKIHLATLSVLYSHFYQTLCLYMSLFINALKMQDDFIVCWENTRECRSIQLAFYIQCFSMVMYISYRRLLSPRFIQEKKPYPSLHPRDPRGILSIFIAREWESLRRLPLFLRGKVSMNTEVSIHSYYTSY